MSIESFSQSIPPQSTLSVYVSELLYEHACVIVPGFGGFVGRYSSAKISRKRGQIDPPRKEVLFNPKLKVNDGLLADHVSRRQGISFERALVWIDQEQHQWRRQLKRQQRLHLPQLGRFFRGEEGKWLFRADADMNWLPDAYGLESLPCLEPASDTGASRAAAWSQKLSEPLRLVGAVAVGILLAFMGYWGYSLSRSSSQTPMAQAADWFSGGSEAQAPDAGRDSPALQDTARSKPSGGQAGIRELGTAIERWERGERAATPQKPRYYVIAASYTDLESARELHRLLEKDGFESEVLLAGPDRYRVSIFQSTEMDSARGLLRRWQPQWTDSLWILTRQ